MVSNASQRNPAECSTAFFQSIDSATCDVPDISKKATIWVCLRGSLAVDTRDGPFILTRRQYLTLPHDYRATLLPGHSSLGLLAAFSPALPTSLSLPVSSQAMHRGVFALASNASSALLRTAIDLLRNPERRDTDWSDFQMRQLLQHAQAGQPEILQWLESTPGRTQKHRRTALQRLLYARNMILNRPFEENTLDVLASAARYSKSHFVKTFRDVFGETPGALHATARIHMAKLLMGQSGLSIGEIAADVGYGSRCAFSRMFKSRMGMNASSFRKRDVGAHIQGITAASK